MSQALRGMWGEMGRLEAVASVATTPRKAPSCRALLCPLGCQEAGAMQEEGGAAVLLRPHPLCPGPTQDGLLLG